MSTSDEMSAQSFQGSADDTEVVPGQEFAERDQTISYGGGGGPGGCNDRDTHDEETWTPTTRLETGARRHLGEHP
jgi:hypothetical protein